MAAQQLQTKLKRLARRLRDRSVHPIAVCRALLSEQLPADLPELKAVAALLADQDLDARHYWIGTFYTLLIDPEVRRRQAAYFTPAPLARRLIDLVEAQGCNLRRASVFDPAAGGAAFLSTVAAHMVTLGRPPKEVAKALSGLDVDGDLAGLARDLISQRLDGVALAPDRLAQADALRAPVTALHDLVLVNPPFGRRMGADLEGIDWSGVASPGHVNIYALFVEVALRWAKPGGLIGLIIPTSFIAGPSYNRLRRRIRDSARVLTLGLVADRDAVFLDVAQDVCLLVLQRHSHGHAQSRPVTFGVINAAGEWVDTAVGYLPRAHDAAWPLPLGLGNAAVGGAHLADYGVDLKVGYFVWNREEKRLRQAPEEGAVPLFWARNVRAGKACEPAARKRDGIDYVTFDGESSGIDRGPAILLQRTTNSKQARRLVAGLIGESPPRFTTENHTILIRPVRPDANLRLLCQLLNTGPVDQRYRRLSGTASVSAKLLKRLDLPHPDVFARALAATGDPERAAELAYETPSAQRRAA